MTTELEAEEQQRQQHVKLRKLIRSEIRYLRNVWKGWRVRNDWDGNFDLFLAANLAQTMETGKFSLGDERTEVWSQ